MNFMNAGVRTTTGGFTISAETVLRRTSTNLVNACTHTGGNHVRCRNFAVVPLPVSPVNVLQNKNEDDGGVLECSEARDRERLMMKLFFSRKQSEMNDANVSVGSANGSAKGKPIPSRDISFMHESEWSYGYHPKCKLSRR